MCRPLSPLGNGTIFYTDQTFGFNTVATHTCNTGFTLIGDSTRTCDQDGKWSGVAQTCVRKLSIVAWKLYEPISCTAIHCGELSTIENGRTIRYSGDATAPYDLDTIATYMCNDGYVLERVVERRCTAGVGGSSTGVWTGRDPTCARKSNSCGLLD